MCVCVCVSLDVCVCVYCRLSRRVTSHFLIACAKHRLWYEHVRIHSHTNSHTHAGWNCCPRAADG